MISLAVIALVVALAVSGFAAGYSVGRLAVIWLDQWCHRAALLIVGIASLLLIFTLGLAAWDLTHAALGPRGYPTYGIICTVVVLGGMGAVVLMLAASAILHTWGDR